MAVIAFPTVFRVTNVRFEEARARSRSFSPFSFAEQVYVWPGRRWSCEMIVQPHPPAQAHLIDAFLAQLRTEENVVQFAGTTFKRTAGPSTLNWLLAPSSPAALSRREHGWSEPTPILWLEAKL